MKQVNRDLQEMLFKQICQKYLLGSICLKDNIHENFFFVLDKETYAVCLNKNLIKIENISQKSCEYYFFSENDDSILKHYEFTLNEENIMVAFSLVTNQNNQLMLTSSCAKLQVLSLEDDISQIFYLPSDILGFDLNETIMNLQNKKPLIINGLTLEKDIKLMYPKNLLNQIAEEEDNLKEMLKTTKER